MEIKTIAFNSSAYQETLALRQKVMREPLGLNIDDEDFSFEANRTILGAYQEQQLIGLGVMELSEQAKVEYLVVDSEIQSRGTGTQILQALEVIAKNRGYTEVTLDARVSAQSFYERLGYLAEGLEFVMAQAPVPHIVMKKRLP